MAFSFPLMSKPWMRMEKKFTMVSRRISPSVMISTPASSWSWITARTAASWASLTCAGVSVPAVPSSRTCAEPGREGIAADDGRREEREHT